MVFQVWWIAKYWYVIEKDKNKELTLGYVCIFMFFFFVIIMGYKGCLGKFLFLFFLRTRHTDNACGIIRQLKKYNRHITGFVVMASSTWWCSCWLMVVEDLLGVGFSFVSCFLSLATKYGCKFSLFMFFAVESLVVLIFL